MSKSTQHESTSTEQDESQDVGFLGMLQQTLLGNSAVQNQQETEGAEWSVQLPNARLIWDAMGFIRTDSQTILDVLRTVHGSAENINKLRMAFQAHTGLNLKTELSKALSKNDAVTAFKLLRIPETPENLENNPEDYTQSMPYARTIWDAMKGWGTDEEKVMNVLQMVEGDAAQINGLRMAFQELTGFNLKQVLHSELSGPLLVSALDCLRIPQSEVEEPQEETVEEREATPYLNQRDNETEAITTGPGANTEKGGDAQCAPTTATMVILSEIGHEEMCKRAQTLFCALNVSIDFTVFEKMNPEHIVWDYIYQRTETQWKQLLKERGTGLAAGYPLHKISSVLACVIEEFTQKETGVRVKSGNETPSDILKALTHFPVAASTKLTGGHVVEVLEVMEEGIRINDPYGARRSRGYLKNGESGTAPPIHRFKLNPELSAEVKDNKVQTKREDWGKDNFYTWTEVEKYQIGWYVFGVGVQS